MNKVVVWVDCTGEAHQPGNMSDHCMVCLPYWGEYPTCPVCGRKVRRLADRKTSFEQPGKARVYYCPNPGCELYRKHLAEGE